MNNFQSQQIFDEHFLLQTMEVEYNVPAYDIIKKIEPFYVPNVLSFFDMIVKYMKMKEILEKNN